MSKRGSKAKRQIRHGDIVINRLGQGDDVEAGLMKAQRAFLRPAAAKTYKAFKTVFVIILDDHIGHVARPAVNQHPVRLVAAGAEDRAPNGENSCERILVKLQPAVFDQAAKAIAKADDFHPVKTEGGFADTTNGGVEARRLSPPAVRIPMRLILDLPIATAN